MFEKFLVMYQILLAPPKVPDELGDLGGARAFCYREEDFSDNLLGVKFFQSEHFTKN
jgi:hypothetical protein